MFTSRDKRVTNGLLVCYVFLNSVVMVKLWLAQCRHSDCCKREGTRIYLIELAFETCYACILNAFQYSYLSILMDRTNTKAIRHKNDKFLER